MAHIDFNSKRKEWIFLFCLCSNRSIIQLVEFIGGPKPGPKPDDDGEDKESDASGGGHGSGNGIDE